MRRLRVIQTPLFAVYLHKHLRPDPQRELHDHPFSFVSIIFKGAYRERRMASVPLRHDALSVRWMKAEWPHSILELLRVPTWTLLLCGRRRREFGFHTAEGWKNLADYEKWVRSEPSTRGNS